MLCTEVFTSVEELHEQFSVVPFSQSVVATDLAEIEKHLAAGLEDSME